MNYDNFTLKSQEAIQKAQEIAMGYQNQAVETGHLLKGILAVDESVTPYLFKKNNVNLQNFQQVLDRIVKNYPKVTGGNLYLAQEVSRVLQSANAQLREFDDEFISIEHLVLALLKNNDNIGQLMKDSGITEKNLKAAITELRKGSKVNSQSAEETYNALGKYANDLNKLALSGKLDPVIGRDEEIRRILQILSRRT
ncbi:MAG: type VI secretion system ATPase TssH, partial [Bacteroidales bacterium]|nr:type VI secretion system ATPase TssH [Bacteroidales bacterium]